MSYSLQIANLFSQDYLLNKASFSFFKKIQLWLTYNISFIVQLSDLTLLPQVIYYTSTCVSCLVVSDFLQSHGL